MTIFLCQASQSEKIKLLDDEKNALVQNEVVEFSHKLAFLIIFTVDAFSFKPFYLDKKLNRVVVF